jgi:tRNA threonylcarbamoyladenosine biosynthesis protein TsaB
MSDLLILGIETSGILCSVAWWQNGSTLLEYNLERKNEHAVVLAAFVDKGFRELGIDPADTTHVAVGSGPGSFTGLRIGMSYAKGFCFGHKIPFIPVTNFEILSDLVSDNEYPIYTLIEAGKGNYYTGVFDRDKNSLDETFFYSTSDLQTKISESGIIVVHEETSKGYFTRFFDKSVKIIDGQYSASRICSLGQQKIEKGQIAKLDEIEPFYLQAFAGIS